MVKVPRNCRLEDAVKQLRRRSGHDGEIKIFRPKTPAS